ncbi:hypothetical protein TNCV_4105801 [Trichonephila clavipes]|nr:hypothetical protein TNCV_4105801 [Trichonephila clavipes]
MIIIDSPLGLSCRAKFIQGKTVAPMSARMPVMMDIRQPWACLAEQNLSKGNTVAPMSARMPVMMDIRQPWTCLAEQNLSKERRLH